MKTLAQILANQRPHYHKPTITPAVFYGRHGLTIKHHGWNMAKCPFHDDKHASFSVNGEHGGFICHACGVKGSMIGFYMQYHHASYQEAIKAIGGMV